MKTSEHGIELIKRWAIVGGPDECWPFKGRNIVYSRNKRLGYGQVTFNMKKYRAHRLVASLFVGEVKPENYVCHSCDNPLCLNPKHLFIGTPQDNVDDMLAKGRHRAPRGEESKAATISDAKVAEVRRLALAGHNQRLLAQQFGISQPLVSMIKNGKTRVAHGYENL
jgi:hypothetical protein